MTVETPDERDAYELAISLVRDAIEGADDDLDAMEGDDVHALFALAAVDALAGRADILGPLHRHAEARDFESTVRDAWRSR